MVSTQGQALEQRSVEHRVGDEAVVAWLLAGDGRVAIQIPQHGGLSADLGWVLGERSEQRGMHHDAGSAALQRAG